MSSKHARIAMSTSTATGTAYTMHLVMCHLSDPDGMLTGYTMTDLAKLSRLGQRAARYVVSSLCSDGLIVRVDRPGKTPDYMVLPNADSDTLTPAESCPPARNRTPAEPCPPTPAEPCRGQDDNGTAPNSLSHKGLDAVVDLSEKGQKSSSYVYTYSTSKKKEGEKERKDIRSKFDFATWQRQYADLFWQRLQASGALARSLATMSPSKRESELDKWADVIDKINRLDGYTPDEIAAVARWLFAPGNWWIETGNLRTVNKLRIKNSADERYFDILYAQMKGSQVLDFDIGGYLTEAQMRKVCQVKGLTKDDFWERGKNTRTGEMDYTIKDEARERAA